MSTTPKPLKSLRPGGNRGIPFTHCSAYKMVAYHCKPLATVACGSGSHFGDWVSHGRCPRHERRCPVDEDILDTCALEPGVQRIGLGESFFRGPQNSDCPFRNLRIHENWGDLGKDTPYPMMNESLMFRLPGLHSGMVLVHDTCGMPQPESGRYTAGSSELSYQPIRQLQFAPRTSQGLVNHLRASWTRRGALGARNSQDLIWFACGKLYKC